MGNYTSTVFLVVLIAVASAEAQLVTKKKPMEMRPVIGGFLLGIFLLAIGSVSERAGKMFGILIAVTAVFVFNGPALFNVLTPKK